MLCLTVCGCVDEIAWFELCENRPVTKEQTVMCFGELANAFRLLHQFSDHWTDDAVISVIDEMICMLHSTQCCRPSAQSSASTLSLIYPALFLFNAVCTYAAKTVKGNKTTIKYVMLQICCNCANPYNKILFVV